MDLLKLTRRKSRLSDTAYIILNVGLALALFFVVRNVESPVLALLLVVLSKWRVLAVRPRFWVANILANMVDLIVGISLVAMLYAASSALWLQIALTLLYVGWLLFIKPRSKRRFVAIQAGTAIFMGVSAVMMIAHHIDVALVVILLWIIGFSAARHVLAGYEEVHAYLVSFIWGLVFAEIGWLAYHWTFAYTIPGFGELKFVQAAIILLAISFVCERAFASQHKYGAVRQADVLLPTIFSTSIIILLVVFFNSIALGGVGGLE